MAESETLYDVFLDELMDAYDAEKQLVKALGKMSKSSSSPELAAAFASHLEETQGQVAMLEEVFQMLEEPVKGKHCPGIAGIIAEGEEAMSEKETSALLDVCLVGGGKRAEHYEIAAYTSLIAIANQLGYEEAAEKLDEILQQEFAADETLDELAEALLATADDGDEGDDDEED